MGDLSTAQMQQVLQAFTQLQQQLTSFNLRCSGVKSAAADSTATAAEQPFDSLLSPAVQHQQPQQITVATQESAALAAVITTTEAVETVTASATEAEATTNSLTVGNSNKSTHVNALACTTTRTSVGFRHETAVQLAAVAELMMATVAEFPFDPGGSRRVFDPGRQLPSLVATARRYFLPRKCC